MKTLICLLTLLPSALPAFGATLTQAERDRAVAELQGSRKAFLDSVAGLSAAQWNYKPDENTWSVAECAEHITLSEDFIFGMISQKLMKAPIDPDKRPAVTDDFILTSVVDRSHKFKAPEPLVPSHKWPTTQAMLDHFSESRDHTVAWVRDTQDDLRAHTYDHPVLKTMDGYQWILLLSAHTQRHTAQLNEVKANANFPKE